MDKKERSELLRKLVQENEYLFYSINLGSFTDPIVCCGYVNNVIHQGFMEYLGSERFAVLMALLVHLKTDGTSTVAYTRMEKLTRLPSYRVKEAIKIFVAYDIISINKVKCPTNNFEMNCYTINKVKFVYNEDIGYEADDLLD